MIRIAVMGSTRGSGLKPFVLGLCERKLNASVEFVLSNKKDAGILDRARELNLLHECIEAIPNDRRLHEEKIIERLRVHRIDVIVLMGYMRILSPFFIEAWRDRIVNVHPSLLPEFSGLMDLNVHQAVIDAGKKETGCTVHIVNEVVDGGRILVQKKCSVLDTDTAENLKARVQALEIPALLEVFGGLMNNSNNE